MLVLADCHQLFPICFTIIGSLTSYVATNPIMFMQVYSADIITDPYHGYTADYAHTYYSISLHHPNLLLVWYCILLI